MRMNELIPSLCGLVTLEVDLFRPVRTEELIIKTHFKSYQLPLLLLFLLMSVRLYSLFPSLCVSSHFLPCSTSLRFAPIVFSFFLSPISLSLFAPL